MPLDPVFGRCFSPVFGRPCWNVRPGYGSFITMEFGEPHLEIREPKQASHSVSSRVSELLARRTVTVHGEWHLWIYCCEWSIFNSGRLIGSSEDPSSFESATQFLDGQALTSTATESSTTTFTFDLGGTLTTKPFDEKSEQWMFFQPDGFILTLRADGMYCFAPSNPKTQAVEWNPVWQP